MNKNRDNKLILLLMVVFIIFEITHTVLYVQGENKQYRLIEQVIVKQEAVTASVNDALNLFRLDMDTLYDDCDRQFTELYQAETETKLLEVQIEMAAVDKIEDPMERFVAYKDVCEEYKDWVGMPITIYDYYSEDEINLLQRVVETETHGADFMSKVHVAEVVLNRVDNERWPNTITGVITQPNQFSYGHTKITESTKLAVEYAFMEEDDTQGALSFHSNEKTDTFGRYIFIFSDGNHNFYGEKGGEDDG